MINLSSLLGGGMLLKQQLITESGNWVRPAKMAGNTVWLTMIGGGSSGVASSPVRGGMGGQYVIRVPVDIEDATSIACTIGLGGAAVGNSPLGANNPGGTTSFGTLLSVLGGSTPTGQGGANGGSAATNSISSGQSTPMGSGGIVITNSSGRAGGGGGLVLDASQIQAGHYPNEVIGAKGYGAGGSYVSAGVAGAPGAILVEWPEFV